MADIITFNGKRCTRIRWTNISTIANNTIPATTSALLSSTEQLPEQSVSTLSSSNAVSSSLPALSTSTAPISQDSTFIATPSSSSVLSVPAQSSVQLAFPASAGSTAISENNPQTIRVSETSSTTLNVLPLPQVSTQPNESPSVSPASQTTAKSINSSLLPLPSVLITGDQPASSTDNPTAAPTSIPVATAGALPSVSSSSDGSFSAGHDNGFSSASHVHKTAIAGGVAGAVVGLAAFGLLLFICCRRRKVAQTEKKHVAANQNPLGLASDAGSARSNSIMARFHTVMGLLCAKIRTGKDHGGANKRSELPYTLENNPELLRSSFRQPIRRSRTRSAPPSRLRLEAEGGVAPVGGTAYPNLYGTPRDSPRSLSDGVVYRTPNLDDPFRDPEPALLRVMNPDSSPLSTSLSTPRKAIFDGQADRQRSPLTAVLPITLQSSYQHPFPGGTRNPSSRPHWLRGASHARSQSAWAVPPSRSSLRPPNPSFRTMDHLQQPSVYLLPRPQRNFVRSNTTPQPPSDSTIDVAETGRSQPAPPWAATTRMIKGTSDPFDLDRPEILGYESPRQGVPRNVNANQSQASRSSSSSRSRERSSRSSTPNWVFENG